MRGKAKTYKVWMWPIWGLSLLTGAKSFQANPIIGARHLNLCGLHVLRVLLARLITRFRWILLAPLLSAKERRAFHENGFLLVEDFLPDEAVDAIRKEIQTHTGDVRQMTQGNTATQRILLTGGALAHMPTVRKTTHGRHFKGALAYGAATLTPSLLYIQRIRNGFRESHADPQKNMHADTFHPTMKAWLFLEDVSTEKGPFTYVPGSQRLTWKRLKWEYERSLTARETPDGYSEKGSFRASEEDLKTMGLPAPKGITAKKGTLVVANTNGFHGRGQAKDGQSRLEIWAYNRPNPFNPIPGIPFKIYGIIQNAVLNAHWRRKDDEAARKNSRASWHLVDPATMLDFDNT